jgi:hypothetical protein
MKTTILTIALGLASLTFAQTPAPTTPAPADSKPAASTKTTKHHKAAKKPAKTSAKVAPSTEQTPVKK